MPRKVIIDCDPGIDDAVALCMALCDPRLEVVAVTATSGNVSAEISSRNVQAIIELLDPPRLPRVGAATAIEEVPAFDGQSLHGKDGLGGAGLPVSELHHPHLSEKIICDAIRSDPEQISILALGPLTNIARAFHRDPTLPSMVDRIIMMGGCQVGRGNMTPAAEFNILYDPTGAREVFHSPTTKTLVPLEVTSQVVMTLDFLEELPDESTWIGAFLRRAIPFTFRSHRQVLGLEGIFLHDAVALVAMTDPELFQTEEMAADVETGGTLTTGATVFDLRDDPQWRANMEVSTGVDVTAVTNRIVRALAQAGNR